MTEQLFKKISLALVLVSALLLLSYTAYRAYNVPISHDEAVTFRVLHERDYDDILWYTIAEDHMINSLLMKKIILNFGNTEWKLRLPNLFGHILYLVFSFLILWRFGPKKLIFPAFLFLNLNPYLLDFFSIARGYGLSVGFMIPSIYFFLEYTRKYHPLHLIGAYLFAALSVLTLVTLLNYYIILTGIAVCFIILGFFSKPLDIKKIIFLAFGLLFIGLFSYYLYDYLSFMLSRLQDRSFVKHNNFFNFYEGTIRTISFRSMYTKDSGHLVTISSYTIMLAYALALGLFVYQLTRQNLKAFSEPFVLILGIGIGMALSVSFQNLLLQIRYPSDRAALFFAPAFALMILFLLFRLYEFRKLQLTATILLGCFAAIAVYNMFRHGNFTHYVDWNFDRAGKEMIVDLEKIAEQPGREVELGATWIFEPSANYYRKTDGHFWLKEVSRDSLYEKPFDFYYLRIADTAGLQFTREDILKEYPEAQTLLLKGHKTPAAVQNQP